MSLQEAFRVSPSVMPGSAEAQRMTVTSGLTCLGALTKSSPIGSFVRTLLESSRWWSKARYLKWQIKPLFSTRATEFQDTNSERPLPFNESATTLAVTDTKSSRYLFRLAVSEPPTEGTESSSSDTVLLQIPTSVQTDETPESMRARAERNGYKNGTKFGSLTSQVKYDPRVKEKLSYKEVTVENVRDFLDPIVNSAGILPTPTTIDFNTAKTTETCVERIHRHGAKGVIPSDAYSLRQAAVLGLLPTPTAIEGTKYTNTYNPNSQMGQSLSAMAGSGLLPTPIATDIQHKKRVEDLKETGAQTMASRANGANRPNGLSDFINFYEVEETTPAESDGETSRLSPLFTEEMMGFPFLWTTLPFLQANGGQKR